MPSGNPNALPEDAGRLEEPVFVRGFDPLAHRWKRPAKPSQWARHFELGRLHPGQWMLISEVKKGGCKERARRIGSDRQTVLDHLERRWPEEHWQARQLTVSGTWCDRQLYLRYIGLWAPGEKEAWLAENQRRYREKMAKSAENKERKRLEARRKAAEDEARAKVRIRARRKPGE